MARIHRLESPVIDRIAAGEVVERPASAVKELVENALDAGASRVDVAVDGGGVDRILVRDDGSGMSAEDARLSLERHATSKIATDADLSGVETFGFRGEALPSIASVSKLTLTTSDGSSPEAVRLRIEFGGPVSEEPAARARGTDVLVEGLFSRTPARRKFLASPEAEARAVAAAVTKAALSNHAVAFTLLSNGRETLEAPAAVDRGARILQVFGRAALGELELFEARSGALRLVGYATRGAVTFPSRRYQYLFVNGRPVEDRALSRAIGQASRDAIRLDRHPAVFLYLTAEPGAVDVNVSPAKTQVRFADGATAFRLVYHAMNSALLAGKEERRLRPVPSGGLVAEPPGEYRDPFAVSVGVPVGVPAPPREEGAPAPQARRRPRRRNARRTSSRSASTASPSSWRRGPKASSSSTSTRPTSARSTNASATGSPRDGCCRSACCCGCSSRRRRRKSRLSARASPTSRRPVSRSSPCRAVPTRSPRLPAEATDRDPAETLRMALAALADSGSADEALRRDRLAASLACRSAVTIRYHLAPEEIRHLISDWAKTRDRFTCPHGRPVVLSMSEEELEKYFKRR